MKKLRKTHFQYFRKTLGVDTDDEVLEIVKKYIDLLDKAKQERIIDILKMRCGIHEDHIDIFMTLDEIGNCFSLRKERVRQILAKGIRLINWRYKNNWSKEKQEEYDNKYNDKEMNMYYNKLELSTRLMTRLGYYFRDKSLRADEVTMEHVKELVESGDIYTLRNLGVNSVNELLTSINRVCGTNYELVKDIKEFMVLQRKYMKKNNNEIKSLGEPVSMLSGDFDGEIIRPCSSGILSSRDIMFNNTVNRINYDNGISEQSDSDTRSLISTLSPKFKFNIGITIISNKNGTVIPHKGFLYNHDDMEFYLISTRIITSLYIEDLFSAIKSILNKKMNLTKTRGYARYETEDTRFMINTNLIQGR